MTTEITIIEESTVLEISEEVFQIAVVGAQGPAGARGQSGPGIVTGSGEALEALPAGSWVIFDEDGVLLASSLGGSAQAYILEATGLGATATFFIGGENDMVPLGSFTSVDIGKDVFLGLDGSTVLTPPTTSGAIIQRLGRILAVAATVTVAVDFGEEYIV